MNRLEIKGVSKEFRNGVASTLALDSISLAIPGNKITAILGPSGCGKTTLLNLVAGFIKPTDGEIMLNKQKITSPGSDIGVVFQEPTLFEWLTVRKNIEFGMQTCSQEADCKELVSAVGLDGFEDHYPFMLSLGMQQRVALARTLAVRPKILLMDEPFASLDPLTREKMQELILSIYRKTQIPIVFVTHDVEEALFLASQICVMTKRPGRIKAIINNPLPAQRDHNVKYNQEFILLRKQITSLLSEDGRESGKIMAMTNNPNQAVRKCGA